MGQVISSAILLIVCIIILVLVLQNKGYIPPDTLQNLVRGIFGIVIARGRL